MQTRSMLAIGLLVAALGCGDDLPLRERIASTRPLAVRVEVLDPAADADAPVRVEALPIERVRLVPWIVDPREPLSDERILAEIEPVWLACPIRPFEGLFACLSARLPLSPDELVACPEPSVADVGSLDQLPELPIPCRIEGGSAARPELVVPLDPSFVLGGDLEITMVGHVPGVGSTASCLERLLERPEAFADECLYLTQRLPVGPDALLLQLALDLGLATPEQLGPIPDTIPEPDANPRIIRFSVAVVDASGRVLETHEVARGEVLELPAGAKLEIETEAPESDLQTFLVPRDGESFGERQETYSGQWFRNWGDLLSASSNDPVSRNTWTLEPGPQDEDAGPPSGRATLYYVLRDSRQGVDWWWFHVDVTRD